MAATYLPAAPLAEWLRAKADEVGDVRTLARSLGIDESQLRRRMRCSGQVTLAVADELFVRADEPHMLALLYPPADPPAPVATDCELQSLMAEIRADHARRGLFV